MRIVVIHILTKFVNLNDQDFESIFVVKDDEVHVPNYMALKKKKEDEMNDKRRFCSFAFFNVYKHHISL